MLILSIDSSGHHCSACVWQDGSPLSQKEERMNRGQDARLVPLINEALAASETSFAQLDRIAVTRGPGSFTGLRIGLATARGIGLAASKPVVGIDRFSIHREQHKNRKENLLIVLDSKRQELFCRLYPYNDAANEPRMLTITEISALANTMPQLIVAGDSNELLRDHLPNNTTCCDLTESEATTCASLAALADLNNQSYLPRPLYLRAPDVTMKTACASKFMVQHPIG